MRRIVRHYIEIEDLQEIRLPINSQMLDVGADMVTDKPYLDVLESVDALPERVIIRIFGFNQDIETPYKLDYIGSFSIVEDLQVCEYFVFKEAKG